MTDAPDQREETLTVELAIDLPGDCPVVGAGPGAAEIATRIVDGVCRSDVVVGADDETTVQSTRSPVGRGCVCPAFADFDVVPQIVGVTDEGLLVRTYVGDRSTLTGLVQDLRSVPASVRLRRIASTALADPETIPLVVAFDTVIGETSQYADYLLPEPTYLERWENFGTYPNKRLADEKISHPVVSVIPDARPAEDVLIDVWKEMDLPGVGEDAILDSEGETWPLDRAEDFYLKLVANLAHATKAYPNYDADADDNGFELPPGTEPGDFPDDEVGPVPDASDAELALFERAHAKGLGEAFDVDRWKGAVRPAEWAKVVTVLNRGGRFEEPIQNYEAAFEEYGYDYDYAGRFNPSNAYVGEHMRYKLASAVYFYAEAIATGKHSYTGERHDPLPRVEDVRHYDGTVQAPVVSDVEPERPLRFVNWKPRTQGMHRTQNSPWLRETRQENPVWIHPDDAAAREVENGDPIEIDAGRRTVGGIAMVTDGIRPGVVGAMWGWGRTGDGATATTIDGERSAPAEADGHTPYRFDTPMQDEAGLAGPRDAGFPVNHIQPLDVVLGDVAPSDVVGGSNAQYDAFVEIRKRR